MYSGHCSAPWLTKPSTLFVCACAFPGNPVAQATTTAAAQAALKLSLRADLMICSMASFPFITRTSSLPPQRKFSIRYDPGAQPEQAIDFAAQCKMEAGMFRRTHHSGAKIAGRYD